MLKIRPDSHFGVPTGITAADLLQAQKACDILESVALALNVNKLSPDALALAFGIPQSTIELNKVEYSPEQVELFDILSRSIENETDGEVRKNLWGYLNYGARYEMLMPEIDRINVNLYELLDLDCDHVRKAFMRKHVFVKPIESSYSTQYGQIDESVSEQLAKILVQMPLTEACDLVASMNAKVLYLMATYEIATFVGNDDERRMIMMCALKYDDIIPVECALLSWIQDNAPRVFDAAIENFLNPDFPENRALFHESGDRIYGETFFLYITDTDIPMDTLEEVIDNLDKQEG